MFLKINLKPLKSLNPLSISSSHEAYPSQESLLATENHSNNFQKSLENFLKELYCHPGKVSREDELIDKLELFLKNDEVLTLNAFRNFPKSVHAQWLSDFARKGFDKLLTFFLKLEPFSVNHLNSLLKKKDFLTPVIQNKCHNTLQILIKEKYFSEDEEYFSKALFNSVCFFNFEAFHIILTDTSANPSRILSHSGMNTLQAVVTTIYDIEKTLSNSNLSELYKMLDAILEIPSIDILAFKDENSKTPYYTILNYAKFNSNLNDKIISYFKRFYEFSLHNFLNLFQDNINNFSNSLSLLDEGCFISLPIEILRKNNFLNCFCKNFIDKNNFKTENIEVRFASHILTHGRFTSFEESKAYFVLGRFSEDNVTLYFDIFDFNQLYNYMLEQKPLICPSTINRLLTVADYYDYKTLNSSFLIPLHAFI